MPYVITEACINIKDRACVDVCPVDCIYEGPDQLFIKPDECIDCGACEPECPVSAIFEQSTLPSEWLEFADLDRRWCTGDDAEKNAVRARINEIQPPVV
jgi:ferredoxin